MEPDAEVRIILSPASADMLDKIPGVSKWGVAPPMTRGSKACKSGAASLKKLHAPVAAASKPKVRRVRKGTLKVKKTVTKAAEPTLEAADVGPSSFRRTQAGREIIKSQMEELMALDQKAFENSPAFTMEGKCRMKFDGADKVMWKDLLEASGRAFEHMHFDFIWRTAGLCIL